MKPSSEILGYEYHKDTGVWRTVTLADFNNEMEELLKVFSTWEEDTKPPYPLVELNKLCSIKKE